MNVKPKKVLPPLVFFSVLLVYLGYTLLTEPEVVIIKSNCNSSYSHHRCLGGLGDLPDQKPASSKVICEFQNVCFRRNTRFKWEPTELPGEWLYFVSPEEALYPFYNDNGTIINFGDRPVIRHLLSWLDPLKFKMMYNKTGIAEWEHNTKEPVLFYDQTVVLDVPLNTNFGHIVGDELWPSWLLSKIFKKDDIQLMHYAFYPQVQLFSLLLQEPVVLTVVMDIGRLPSNNERSTSHDIRPPVVDSFKRPFVCTQRYPVLLPQFVGWSRFVDL